MTLFIITPLTRGENTENVMQSIMEARPAVGATIDIQWCVVQDPSGTPPPDDIINFIASVPWARYFTSDRACTAGHCHRNEVINSIQNADDAWIYSLDDDNEMHPDFLNALRLADDEGYDGFIGRQIFKDGSLRLTAAPELVKLNHIDTAQYAFKYKLLEGLRFFEDRYDADGVFIETLYSKYPDKFKIVDEPLCYYNYLRP